MAVRGEEVATSIEAHVREAIERMVGEIRSSVEDVREAVDQQLRAALQSVQADVNSITFLPHIRKSIDELEQTFEESKSAASALGGADASRLKKAIQEAERGKSQVDVLNALLEQAVQFGSRAALLILRGETFSGWKGVGFTAHSGNDEQIKRFNAAPGLIPELDRVLRQEEVVEWDGVNLSTRFGVTASSRAILIPMVIKDKVAAAVYVDAVEDDLGKLDAASLEILVFTTGLLIDTLAIRKKVPSPSLNDGTITATPASPFIGTPQAAPAATPAAPTPQPVAPAPAPAAATPPLRNMSAPSPESTIAINSQQIRDMMGTPTTPTFNMPAADEFATPAPRSAPVAPPAEPARPAPAPAAAPVAAPTSGSDERPSTQYIPPSGVSRANQSGGPQGDEAKKHDEARRFARLLVSEIKLYNEQKVDQGRKNRDLYERLKEDIDRSRQMYDERIGEDVRKVSNYFYDELVRILADGQADALGL